MLLLGAVFFRMDVCEIILAGEGKQNNNRKVGEDFFHLFAAAAGF